MWLKGRYSLLPIRIFSLVRVFIYLFQPMRAEQISKPQVLIRPAARDADFKILATYSAFTILVKYSYMYVSVCWQIDTICDTFHSLDCRHC